MTSRNLNEPFHSSGCLFFYPPFLRPVSISLLVNNVCSEHLASMCLSLRVYCVAIICLRMAYATIRGGLGELDQDLMVYLTGIPHFGLAMVKCHFFELSCWYAVEILVLQFFLYVSYAWEETIKVVV